MKFTKQKKRFLLTNKIRETELLLTLTKREIDLRYRRTFLGFLWAILHPIFYLITLAIVFTWFINIPFERYVVYLFSGLLPWIFLTQAVSSGTSSLVTHANLVKKTAFPRILIPLSTIFASFFHFLIILSIFLFIILFYHVIAGEGVIWGHNFILLPCAIILELLFILGIVLMTAGANVLVGDIGYLVSATLPLWFYLSPVIYSIDVVPEAFLPYYMINPMVGILNLYHAFFWQEQLHFAAVTIASIETFAVAVLGYFIFSRYKQTIADYL